MVVALTGDNVQALNEVCYTEYQAKVSNMAALKWILNLKMDQVMELHEEVEELNATVQNMTTEVQEMHTTCEGALASDCCQVSMNILIIACAHRTS